MNELLYIGLVARPIIQNFQIKTKNLKKLTKFKCGGALRT